MVALAAAVVAVAAVLTVALSVGSRPEPRPGRVHYRLAAEPPK